VLAGTLSLSNPGLADSADVYLSTGSELNLLFTGEPDVIRSLFINGIAQPGGAWGSLSSDATNKSPLLVGSGLLFVSQGVAIPVLVGDYNDDGQVNAADYTFWRNRLGEDVALPNRDPLNLGSVNLADYESWKNNYGATAANNLVNTSSTIPEPPTWPLTLASSAFLAIGGTRRRPRRSGSA
jgi:hypothetical protein